MMATDPCEGRLGERSEMLVIMGIFRRLGRSLPSCRPTLRSKCGLSVLSDLGLPRRRM